LRAGVSRRSSSPRTSRLLKALMVTV